MPEHRRSMGQDPFLRHPLPHLGVRGERTQVGRVQPTTDRLQDTRVEVGERVQASRKMPAKVGMEPATDPKVR